MNLWRRAATLWRSARAKVPLRRPPPPHPLGQPAKVLVLGIYLADRTNTVVHLVDAFSSARHCAVTQRWVALNGEPPTTAVAAVTVMRVQARVPKFELLNRLISAEDIESHDYLLVCDDDVSVQPGFLDRLIGWQQHCGFALAQPARSWNSHVDHPFVRRSFFTRARQTRFVEIGPAFSMNRAMARLLVPFDTASPMGWGCDMVWPVLAERHGLTVGIVDDAPMQHSLRPRGAAYDVAPEIEAMAAYLSTREHLKAHEAFTVVRRYR